MVYQHVNMLHIIDHEKNMGFLDLDQNTQRLTLWFVNHHLKCNTNWKLNLLKLKGHISWYHGNPRNENFLIFAFSFEYSRMNHIDHQFFLSPNVFHYRVLVCLGFKSSWQPSQHSAVNCAAACQVHPRFKLYLSNFSSYLLNKTYLLKKMNIESLQHKLNYLECQIKS